MNSLSGGTKEYVYYDVRVKRFRDSRGRFVSAMKMLDYYLTHETVRVRGRSGRFYWSSVRQARGYFQKIIKKEWEPRRDVRTDTLSVDVTRYFVLYERRFVVKNIDALWKLLTVLVSKFKSKYKKRRYYFVVKGKIFDNNGERGTFITSSKQLTERHEIFGYFIQMIDDLVYKVDSDIRKFSVSDLDIDIEYVKMVFKGWDRL